MLRDYLFFGLKGLNRLAQGNALGKCALHFQALKGRHNMSCFSSVSPLQGCKFFLAS